VKKKRLDRMTKGWFVGDFRPSVYLTRQCEVAVKRYPAGAYEAEHYHKVATEITVVVSGQIKMNHQRYDENDIVGVEPNESTDFLAVTDAVTAVVKIPGAQNDKYIGRSKKA